MLTLRPRLLALATRVPHGARVADIGTDHARLPLWLLQRQLVNAATAVDIADGPLKRAAALADHVDISEGLTLLKADGLKQLDPDAHTTIVIAGLGGETIIDILAAAPWSLGKHLLLQPMTHPERLRAYLVAQGITPQETTVADSGRTYTIFECQGDTA